MISKKEPSSSIKSCGSEEMIIRSHITTTGTYLIANFLFESMTFGICLNFKYLVGVVTATPTTDNNLIAPRAADLVQ